MVKQQEFNYELAEMPDSLIKMMPVPVNEGGTNVLLNLGNGPRSTFYSTFTAMYWDKSYLAYTIRLPPGAANTFTWMSAEGCPQINQFRATLKSTGTELINVTNFHKYCNLVLRRVTAIDDVKSRDKLYPYVTAFTAKPPGQSELLSCNNTNPDTAIPYAKRHDNTLTYTAMDEPVYLVRSQSGTVASALELDVLIKFDYVKDLMLDYDKLFYSGGQEVVFEIFWNGYSQMCWSSANATNPGAADGTGATAYNPPDLNPAGGPWGITNLRLVIATETHSSALAWAAQKYQTEGFTYKFRSVLGTKGASSNSSTQTPEVRVTAGLGKRLAKVYWGCYNGTENVNLIFDHSNINGAKVQNYQAYFNDQLLPNGRYEIGTGTAYTFCDDYNKEKEKLKGSCIQSRNEYYYNWCACVDFTQERAQAIDRSIGGTPEENVVQGVVLGPYETKVNFMATTAPAQYNNYMFSVFERELHLAPNVVRLE